MSELCLNSNSKETENIVNILYHLFRVDGNKEYVIRGWGKKILGYGIRQAGFEEFRTKKYPTSEKRFRDYKDKLLNRRLVEVFDKSNRVKGGNRYHITPLGLLFLLTNIENNSTNTITDVFKRLDFTRLNEPRMAFDTKVWKFFKQEQITRAIKQLSNKIEFRFEDNDNEIMMDILLFKSKNRIRVFQAKFNKVDLILLKSFYVQIIEDREPNEAIIVESKKFYWEISFYFTLLLVYYLFNNLENKEVFAKMPFPFQNFVGAIWETISNELTIDSVDNSFEAIMNNLDSNLELDESLH